MISPTSASQTTKSKIDEMTKLVRTLTAKLNKLELDKSPNKLIQEGERKPNQFRCPFVPIFIPRE